MKTYLKLGIAASIFFVFIGIALAVAGVVAFNSTEIFLGGLLWAAIGVGVAIYARKALRKEIEKEKELRKTHGDAFTDGQIKQTNKVLKKSALIGLLAIIVLCAILVPLFVSGGDAQKGCKGCGRLRDLVPGFDYCQSCYESFIERNKDSWATGK